LPYHYFEQFQDALNSDQSNKAAEGRLAVLRQLLRGLSLATGEDNGKVDLPDDNALYLRAVAGKSRPSIFSYRRFEASEFTLRPQQLDGNQGQYVEHRPDRLLLEHHSKPNTSDATLEVSLDLFESLRQTNDGYIPSRDEVQGSLINLSIFRNTLARLPYRQLLLLDGARKYHIAEDGGRLIFRPMEEE
jgi:hypothetical protein